jgi:hypothetical protein
MATPIKVIPWTYRDGSIHLEMRLASFHNEDDELVCHLDGGFQDFKTACGVAWWGKASTSGIAHSERITCPDCRRLLASLTFTAQLP